MRGRILTLALPPRLPPVLHSHHAAWRHDGPQWRPVSARKTPGPPRVSGAADCSEGLWRSSLPRLHPPLPGVGPGCQDDAQRRPETRLATQETPAASSGEKSQSVSCNNNYNNDNNNNNNNNNISSQEVAESPSGTLQTPNSSSSRNSSKMNTIAGSAKVRTSVSEDGPSTIHSRHNTTKLPQIPNTIAWTVQCYSGTVVLWYCGTVVVTQNYPNEYLAVFLCCEIKTHKLSWKKEEERKLSRRWCWWRRFFI